VGRLLNSGQVQNFIECCKNVFVSELTVSKLVCQPDVLSGKLLNSHGMDITRAVRKSRIHDRRDYRDFWPLP